MDGIRENDLKPFATFETNDSKLVPKENKKLTAIKNPSFANIVAKSFPVNEVKMNTSKLLTMELSLLSVTNAIKHLGTKSI